MIVEPAIAVVVWHGVRNRKRGKSAFLDIPLFGTMQGRNSSSESDPVTLISWQESL